MYKSNMITKFNKRKLGQSFFINLIQMVLLLFHGIRSRISLLNKNIYNVHCCDEESFLHNEQYLSLELRDMLITYNRAIIVLVIARGMSLSSSLACPSSPNQS